MKRRMRSDGAIAIVAIAAMAALAGCAEVELGPPQPLGAGIGGELLPECAARASVIGAQPGSAAIDAPVEEAMRVGEQACFALELRDGTAHSQWLLRLEALSAESGAAGQTTLTLNATDGRTFTLASGTALVALTAHGPFRGDGTGVPDDAPAAASVANVPSAFLREGIDRACEVGLRSVATAASGSGSSADPAAPITDEDLRAYCGGFATLFAFLQVVQRDPVLSELLWQVIEKPSALSVLLSGFSVSLGFTPHFDAIEVVREPLPGVAVGYRLPVDLRLNGTPALRMELLVVRPHPPLQICGGIVALKARHPAEAARSLSVWLLSARRGGV